MRRLRVNAAAAVSNSPADSAATAARCSARPRRRSTAKRDFRRLWIARINAAARTCGLSYSRLMNGLKVAGVDVNRKVLAEIAVADSAAFARLAEVARQGLQTTVSA